MVMYCFLPLRYTRTSHPRLNERNEELDQLVHYFLLLRVLLAQTQHLQGIAFFHLFNIKFILVITIMAITKISKIVNHMIHH